MKKYIVLATTLALYCACGTTMTPEEKAAQAAEKAQKVEKAIVDRKFTIDVDYVYPQRMPSRRLDFGYQLTVRNDSVISYLPYFGRAYNIPYGGGDGLNFKEKIQGYSAKRMKKNMTHIELITEHERDTYLYQIDIFDNGNTDVRVNCRERDGINFSGKFKE